jgi:hypothetical protein
MFVLVTYNRVKAKLKATGWQKIGENQFLFSFFGRKISQETFTVTTILFL